MKNKFRTNILKSITTAVCYAFAVAGMVSLFGLSAKAAVVRNYTVDLSNGRKIIVNNDPVIIGEPQPKEYGEGLLLTLAMTAYDPTCRDNIDKNAPHLKAVMSHSPFQGMEGMISNNDTVVFNALAGSQGTGRYVISEKNFTDNNNFSARDAKYFMTTLVYIMDGETDDYEMYNILRSDIVINLEIKYSDAPVVVNSTSSASKSVSFIPGRELEDNGIKYRILDAAGNLSAMQLTAKAKNVNIPDAVSYVGFNLNVTDIAQNFMKGDKNAKKVTIGSNVTSIGKNAFYKSKKLKKVIVKSTKLTSIGKKAFGKNAKGFTVKLPKSCKKAYKKLLKKAKIKL